MRTNLEEKIKSYFSFLLMMGIATSSDPVEQTVIQEGRKRLQKADSEFKQYKKLIAQKISGSLR